MADDLSRFTDEFRRLQNQKHRMRGGVEARVLLNLCLYFGEQYAQQARSWIVTRPLDRDEERNKLHLVFNLSRRATRRKIGRFWAASPEASAFPNSKDPQAFDRADVVSALIRATDDKVHQRQVYWRILQWLMWGGVAIEHVSWVPDATVEPVIVRDDDTGEIVWTDRVTGEQIPQSEASRRVEREGRPPESFTPVEELVGQGDLGADIFGPLNFFIDASVKRIQDLSPDQACYLAEIKTLGWIRETYGDEAGQNLPRSDLSIVKSRLMDRGPSVANLNLRDLIPAIQGAPSEDDPDLHLVLTRYQPAHRSFPRGRRTILVPNARILDDDAIPYGEVPLVDFHYEPTATSFWSGDFLTDLVAPQKFLNKRLSQLGESANASLYEMLLLGGELTSQDLPADVSGAVEEGLDHEGRPRVLSHQHAGVPGWFLESIRLVADFFQEIGSADLFGQRKFPGQLRGPLALPLLQEILDSEDGPLFDHLGEQLALEKQMRINRIKAFYPPSRTLHYTSKDLRDEVLEFHADEILRAGTDFAVRIDRSSLVPELAALREAKVRERLSGPLAIIYTNPRTGRLDPSRIAMDLKYTDVGRESKTAQYRRLAQQFVGKLWKGESLPPTVPLPFWDHEAMMDELESAMATMEFLSASLPVQQAFLALYEKHRQMLASIQDAQAQAVQGQMMQSAVAQATQQVAATTAARTMEDTIEQLHAQSAQAARMPPEELFTRALAEQEGREL